MITLSGTYRFFQKRKADFIFLTVPSTSRRNKKTDDVIKTDFNDVKDVDVDEIYFIENGQKTWLRDVNAFFAESSSESKVICHFTIYFLVCLIINALQIKMFLKSLFFIIYFKAIFFVVTSKSEFFRYFVLMTLIMEFFVNSITKICQILHCPPTWTVNQLLYVYVC